ncbi:threonine transporter (plasmid) [Burkholderia sp. THE68]|nr:threonine transporter [Burkholderia sp. THE68]
MLNAIVRFACRIPHAIVQTEEDHPMTASNAVLAILFSLLLGAMIPGPSFVLVARNAIGISRADGLATALGMGVGGIFFGGIALAGLYTLLVAVEWLYIALKVAGGLYLIHIAWKIWRGAAQPMHMPTRDDAPALMRSARKSFWLGLTTQLSNPKTAIWYGSIFAALLPQHPPLWCYFVLPPMVFAIETGWYTVVALGFSSQRPRDMYLRAKKWIDRIASSVIAALGLRLVLTAGRTGL